MASVVKGHPIARWISAQRPAREEEPSPEPEAFSERSLSLFVSAVFHTAVLLTLGLFLFHHAQEDRLIEVVDARMEPLPVPEAITLADVSVEKDLNASDDTDSSLKQIDARALANASDPPPVVVAEFSHHGVVPVVTPQDGLGWKGDALKGLGDAHGLGDIAGDGSEEPGDGEVGFFGTKAKGKSFVFIVDCSSSMLTWVNSYQPAEQGPVTRFSRARKELLVSLGDLSRDQKFYVIFYSSHTYPMYFPKPIFDMVPAAGHHMKVARQWIESVIPGGGTDPREAFRIALSLRPEVIFFLTDGEIPGATREVAKKNNKSRTRIHTIAFGTTQFHDILKNIANDNQGRFRYVP